MPKKIDVDKKLFGWRPLYQVNGIPWPRLDTKGQGPMDVPLKTEYRMRSMDYLDSDAAKIIFEKQADIVQRLGVSGIVDVGCRTGRINDILHERGYTSYSYMGFDTSPEPIAYSQAVWTEFDNISYRLASWEDMSAIGVDFKVDCVIWSGVLLYRPQDHLHLFHELTVDFYGARFAIIQEPMSEQFHWSGDLELSTIEHELDSYRKKYSLTNEVIVEADIFGGRRKIIELAL